MKRFDIRGENWVLAKRTDGLGTMCWAEDALWYRRQYVMSLIINVVVVLVCGVLAGYLVYHKHDPSSVTTPTLDLEQIGRITQEQQRLQVQLDTAQHTITNLKAQAAQLKAMLTISNVRLAKYEHEFSMVAHSSLPPQPVILQAIQQEALTEKGLRQVVARNFGKDISARIKVVNE